MNTTKLTPKDALLVTIDIAKQRNEVLIAEPGRARRRRMSVLNTRAEHDQLIEALGQYGRPVLAGFEATGNDHRPLAHRLLEAGVEVPLISSLALARTRQALTNGWDKNAPKDAQIILHMLKIGAVQHYHDPLAHGLVDLQELSKTHDAISKAKTELWHRLLTPYLPLYFPEAERFRGNSRIDWFLAFLKAYPTPALITALDKEAFFRGRVAARRARGLQGTPPVRHLRDSAGVDRSARGGRLRCRRSRRGMAPLGPLLILLSPDGARRRPQPRPAAR